MGFSVGGVRTLHQHISVILTLLILCVFHHSICDRNIKLKDIPSVFPSRLKPPGLNAPEKLWWAKEITPDFHVCGRLSERQLKFAKEAGFKSVVSLFTYPRGDPDGNFGGDALPTTENERKLVEDEIGLQFVNLLDPMDEWAEREAIEKFTALVPHLKTPALLRCDRGYTIAFVILLYLANQTRHDAKFEPKINSKNFYEIASSMGLDFYSRIPMGVVSEITGEPVPSKQEREAVRVKLHHNPVEWLDFWFAHAVYGNWFVAGQLERSHLGPLKDFMYKYVVNVRLGSTHNGVHSQEEVNLLNVKSNTGTYGNGNGGSHNFPRQSVQRLKKTRIDASESNEYVVGSSQFNFEVENAREFGDSVGYNEALERQAVRSSGLEYLHMPLGDLSELESFMQRHRKRLIEIGKDGPVLVHCSDGSRAAYVSVLVSAIQHDLTLDWALQRLKEMGFGVALDWQPEVFKAYLNLLGGDSNSFVHGGEL